jgi:hypothetical protein
MGCWNKTCGLSNLHITSGTPVYVFVLEKNNSYDHCYSTGLFSPLLLPFESVYNDYGGGEDSSGIAMSIIMGGIKKDLVEMPLGENKYHDIEVTKEKFDVDLFFEAVHEDRLFTQGRFSAEPTRIQFTMFRKDIVDAILAEREIEEYVGGNKGTYAKWGDEKNYIRYKFADIVANIRPMIAEARAKVEEAKKDNETLASYMLFDGISAIFDYNSPHISARWMRYDNYRYSRIVDMKTVFRKAFEAGTDEAMETLALVMEQHLKALFIDGFMTAARKSWIPGGHEGSQSYSGSALRQLWNATSKVLDEEKRQWAEDMGEEESEYEEE